MAGVLFGRCEVGSMAGLAAWQVLDWLPGRCGCVVGVRLFKEMVGVVRVVYFRH